MAAKPKKEIQLELEPDQYAWLIYTDKMAMPEETPPCNCNAVGMVGPRNAPEVLVEMLKKGVGRKFKMYDADHVLYYEGLILVAGDINDISTDDLGETYFRPLDDFGRPNAGAVIIKYKGKGRNGTWEPL
jgi:hypothetical protein